jgi:hypothetical protein
VRSHEYGKTKNLCFDSKALNFYTCRFFVTCNAGNAPPLLGRIAPPALRWWDKQTRGGVAQPSP